MIFDRGFVPADVLGVFGYLGNLGKNLEEPSQIEFRGFQKMSTLIMAFHISYSPAMTVAEVATATDALAAAAVAKSF